MRREKIKNNLNILFSDKNFVLMFMSTLLITVFMLYGGTTESWKSSYFSTLYFAPGNSNFNDQNFYDCVLDAYQNEHPDESIIDNQNLSDAKLADIKSLTCTNKNISDVSGLEKLTGLEELDLSNNDISYLGSPNNPPAFLYANKIKTLKVDNNKINGLSLYMLGSIEYVSASNNELTSNPLVVSNSSRSITSDTLTYIDFSNNKISSIDISGLSNLSTLKVNNNKLKSLDLTNNTKLTLANINIGDNPYENDTYVYVKNSKNIKAKSAVKTSSNLDFDLSWLISDGSESVEIDDHGAIYSTTHGEATAEGTNSYFTTTTHIHTLALTSDDFEISGDDYIYVGSTETPAEIKENISEATGNLDKVKTRVVWYSGNSSGVNIPNELDDDVSIFEQPTCYLELVDKNSNEVLVSIPVHGVKSAEYNLNNDYIYIGNKTFDVSKIVSTNLINEEASDNKLKLTSADGKFNKSYDLVSYESDTYDLSKDYVWVGSSEFDASKVTVTNGVGQFDSNNYKFKILSNSGKIVHTWDVIRWTTDAGYDLTSTYLNCNGKNLLTTFSNISLTNGAEISFSSGSTIRIRTKDNEKVVDLPIVNFYATKYAEYLDEDYIFTGTEDFDFDDIKAVSPATVEYGKNGSVAIKRNDNVLKKWTALGWKSDIYDLNNDYILVGGKSNAEILSNVYTTTAAAEVSINEYDQLVLSLGNEVIDKKNLIRYSSTYYDLSKSYIFVGSSSNDFIKSKINHADGSTALNIVNDQLVLSDVNGSFSKSWNLVRTTSDKYYINKNAAYVKEQGASTDDISVTNGSVVGVEGNSLNIKPTNSKDVISLSLVSLTSTYDLSGEYFYVREGRFDIGNVKYKLGDAEYPAYQFVGPTGNGRIYLDDDDNQLKVKLDDTVVQSWKLVSLVSDSYDLSNDYVLVINKSFDESKVSLTYNPKNKYSVIHDSENSILKVKNNSGNTIDQWDIITLSSTEYDIGNGYVNTKGKSFSTSNITTNSNISYNEDTGVLTVSCGSTNKEFAVISYTSNVYDFYDNFVNMKKYSYSDSDITKVGCSVEVRDNNMYITATNVDTQIVLPIVKYTTTPSDLDLTKNYIYLGSKNVDEVISVSEGATVEEVNNKLVVKNGNHELDSWDIIRNNNASLITNGYYLYDKLYLTNESKSEIESDLNKDLVNCHAHVTDDYKVQLISDDGDDVVDSFDIVGYTVSNDSLKPYSVNGVYSAVDIGNNNPTSSDITINGYGSVIRKSNDGNKIDLVRGEDVVATIDVYNYYTDEFDLSAEDYVDLGVNSYSVDDFNSMIIHNGYDIDYTNGKLTISLNGNVKKELNIVTYSSNSYDLGENYIYAEGEDFDSSLVTVTSAVKEVSDDGNSFVIKYGDTELRRWPILKAKFSRWKLKDNKLYIGNDTVTKEELIVDFINNSRNVEIDYSIDTVTSGDQFIIKNDGLRFSRTVTISEDYLDMSNLDVVEDVIKNIAIGTKLETVINKIDTNGTIKVFRGDVEITNLDDIIHTGDKISVVFGAGNEVEFYVSVIGDVTGPDDVPDGILNMNDSIRVLQHYRNPVDNNDKEITEDYRLISSDVTGPGNVPDGVINMNDAIKILKDYRDNINPNLLVGYISNQIFEVGGMR